MSPAVSLDLVAIATGIVALIFLLGLVLFWRVPDSPGRHWLMLFGLGAFPGLALFLGSGAALESAKRPQFCGSCHVMDPFINDMKDPGSTTLAGLHYQNRYILENQCYTCHTEYTIFGPLKAKLAGMRHIWNYETGRYEIPIKLRSPYEIGTCLRCHSESRKFRERHEPDVRQLLASRQVSCLDCHAPVHAPQEEAL